MIAHAKTSFSNFRFLHDAAFYDISRSYGSSCNIQHVNQDEWIRSLLNKIIAFIQSHTAVWCMESWAFAFIDLTSDIEAFECEHSGFFAPFDINVLLSLLSYIPPNITSGTTHDPPPSPNFTLCWHTCYDVLSCVSLQQIFNIEKSNRKSNHDRSIVLTNKSAINLQLFCRFEKLIKNLDWDSWFSAWDSFVSSMCVQGLIVTNF